jgi:hypothetical protein
MRHSDGDEPCRHVDEWLGCTLIGNLPDDWEVGLLRWSEVPIARAAHWREDLLSPLMTAVRAGEGTPAARSFYQTDFGGGLAASSFPSARRRRIARP